jgi:hypothetical protein
MPKSNSASAARAALATREGRTLDSVAAKARYLKEKKFGAAVTAEVLGANIRSVQRWRANPTKSSTLGRNKYLTAEEDAVLVALCLSANACHQGFSSDQVRQKAFDVACARKSLEERPADPPSASWSQKWVNFHPQVQFMVPRPMEEDRARACSEVNIRGFYDRMRDELDPASFNAALTFNFDETMLGFDNKMKAVVISRSDSRTTKKESTMKPEHITIGVCVSLLGCQFNLL